MNKRGNEIKREKEKKEQWPPKCRSRRLGRWHHHRCACITSYSLGCASSRQGIDRLNPRGPHGDSNFVRLRARSALLVPNMAPVGGHVVTTPSPTRLPLKQRAHSTTTRDICSHQFISLSLSLSPTVALIFSLFPPLSLPRSLGLTDLCPLQGWLKYLHGQVQWYYTENFDRVAIMRKLSIHLLLVPSNIEKTHFFPARVFNISGPRIEFPHFSSPILRQLQGKNTGSRVIRSIWLVSLLTKWSDNQIDPRPIRLRFRLIFPRNRCSFRFSFSFFFLPFFPSLLLAGISSLQFSGERVYRRSVDRIPAV